MWQYTVWEPSNIGGHLDIFGQKQSINWSKYLGLLIFAYVIWEPSNISRTLSQRSVVSCRHSLNEFLWKFPEFSVGWHLNFLGESIKTWIANATETWDMSHNYILVLTWLQLITLSDNECTNCPCHYSLLVTTWNSPQSNFDSERHFHSGTTMLVWRQTAWVWSLSSSSPSPWPDHHHHHSHNISTTTTSTTSTVHPSSEFIWIHLRSCWNWSVLSGSYFFHNG